MCIVAVAPLHHHHENRILSPIPENTSQSIFKSTMEPVYYRAFLSSIAYEFKRRIILSDRIKHDIEYHNVFDGKEAVVKRIIAIYHVKREVKTKCKKKTMCIG